MYTRLKVLSEGKATIDRETTRKDKAQSQEKQDEQEIVNVKEDESQLDWNILCKIYKNIQ